MHAATCPFSLLRRLRSAFAGLICLSGFALLLTGFGVSDVPVLRHEAVAGTAPSDPRNAPFSVISKERAALLQSSVDSAALSLGSMLATASALSPDDKTPFPAVASVLSTLTFGLGEEVYFTVWEGTRILHSPLAPDAEGMDFADSTDERGVAFVLDMARTAANGGGFLRVTLPRQFSDADSAAAFDAALQAGSGNTAATRDLDTLIETIVRSGRKEQEEPPARREREGPPPSAPPGADAANAADVADAPPGMAGTVAGMPDYCPINNRFAAQRGGGNVPPPAENAAPVDQVVYVRHIPRSKWHIAAFMPVDPEPGQHALSDRTLRAGRTDDGRAAEYRKGLCVSGFSLAGLAGLMLLPGSGKTRRSKKGHS